MVINYRGCRGNEPVYYKQGIYTFVIIRCYLSSSTFSCPVLVLPQTSALSLTVCCLLQLVMIAHATVFDLIEIRNVEKK